MSLKAESHLKGFFLNISCFQTWRMLNSMKTLKENILFVDFLNNTER